ncbi:hypothetical protein GCM10010441_40730 [Kitasatospora paracochleata]|uniref:NTP pyrophosphohydrolase MazG putative catalytic core domain-containing protein n=1 Tax=Kitasatospora paracochleata TaxID=58354 RepID=A0ABT1J9I9_9ACTN|nr:hypothetical protein [Kitasatospora paracochleata]MCP2314117.1 hypothetical protein [Kitasatospora paracochleata]
MDDLFQQIRELRRRDERRGGAPDHVQELLLVTKVAEEACEAGELYRRSKGWGTDGPVTATRREAQHEMCAAIMAGLVALDRLYPDGDASKVWADYLAYGNERARRENTEAA